MCYFFVYMKVNLDLKLLKYTKVVNEKATLNSSGLMGTLMKEWFILALHPYPFLTGNQIKFI